MLYCTVHGRAHYEGETDHAARVGDELECREEEWDAVPGEVVTSHCEPTETVRDFLIRQGSLVYIDTVFSGLVPVKVLGVSLNQAVLQVTAGRPGYRRNEVIEMSLPNSTLVHRRQVHVRSGMFRIHGRPTVMTDGGVFL